jgi:hypothetical protein
VIHAMVERLIHWFLHRIGVPIWVILAAAGGIALIAAVVDFVRHRKVRAAFRTWVRQRGGAVLGLWRPRGRIGAIEVSLSRIKAPAPTPGRLWLDSRDMSDGRLAVRRAERIRTGDWAFDQAFDGAASPRAFGESFLDGEARGALLKLDAYARRAAPVDEGGEPLHRLRVEWDGRRLDARFRHALDVEDLAGVIDLVERLTARATS